MYIISYEPVTMAVRPDASIPWVTSSAVEDDENPDGPFLQNGHILSLALRINCLWSKTSDSVREVTAAFIWRAMEAKMSII